MQNQELGVDTLPQLPQVRAALEACDFRYEYSGGGAAPFSCYRYMHKPVYVTVGYPWREDGDPRPIFAEAMEFILRRSSDDEIMGRVTVTSWPEDGLEELVRGIVTAFHE